MKNILSILFLFVGASAFAQGAMQLSMDQALQYAAVHSYAVRNSSLEADKALHQLRQIRGTGLPQINASGSYNQYIDIPTQLAPNFFDPAGPEFVELQFGLKYNATAGIQLDQLIFDGSYLVGLQASKAFKENKELELQQTIAEAKAAVAKSYYAVLVAREGIKILEELVPVLTENVRQTKALEENGFAEITDVQRQQLGLSDIQNQLISAKDQESSALNMLHFIIGLPMATPIELADDLDALLLSPDPRALAQNAFDPAGHIDGRVASSMVHLQELNARNEKAAALPKLNGFLSHQQQGFGNEFDMLTSGNYYPATLWGLSLQVPLFSSGVRSNKVQQAQLTAQQVKVNQELVTEQLNLDVAQKRNTVIAAADRYDNQKEDLALARSIFDRTNAKFREGLAGSFEITEERSQLLNTQNAYLQSLADLLLARADLRDALGLF